MINVQINGFERLSKKLPLRISDFNNSVSGKSPKLVQVEFQHFAEQ